MSCPRCGCKVCYEFDRGDDDQPSDDNMERCAACGHIFGIEDHAPEDDDYPEDDEPTQRATSKEGQQP